MTMAWGARALVQERFKSKLEAETALVEPGGLDPTLCKPDQYAVLAHQMAGADGHEDRPGRPHTRRDPVGPAGVAIGKHDSISGGRAAAELVDHAKEDGLIAKLPGGLHVAHRCRQIRRRRVCTVGNA